MNTSVVTSTNSYQIITGHGLLDKLRSLLTSDALAGKKMIVTDDIVAGLYLDKVKAQLPDAELFIIPHGEKSKSINYAERICNELAKCGFTRKDHIFALGGGVVGDLAGFVSSIYMRGIPYIQLPTTLLAGIDSSVGGKTAVNIGFGKNLVGRIYPPEKVVCDLDTLTTLPEDILLDGLGEGLKYAVLCGGELFDIMQRGIDGTNEERFVDLCVGYKKDVVEKDEHETGLRRLLNLGHTMGHAIERESDLKILHGIAVAMGLRIIAVACYNNGLLGKADLDKIVDLIDGYGVPACPFDTAALIKHVAVDKKTEDDVVNLVVIRGIGDCDTIRLPLTELEKFFI